jgi:hypothetical protein
MLSELDDMNFDPKKKRDNFPTLFLYAQIYAEYPTKSVPKKKICTGSVK